MTDERHSTTAGVLLDDFPGSALGTDKHDLILVFSQALDRVQGVVERGNGVLEVNDVNFVACPKNVFIHLGVPEACLVSEVRTCLQQVTHAYLRHSQTLCLG